MPFKTLDTETINISNDLIFLKVQKIYDRYEVNSKKVLCRFLNYSITKTIEGREGQLIVN